MRDDLLRDNLDTLDNEAGRGQGMAAVALAHLGWFSQGVEPFSASVAKCSALHQK
ncbi:MAG: hypothetical protein JNM30_20205 [Rhodospirillales bacterium]|nr:hypothetical protein [Rhodospirillales bacterium]